MFFPTLWNACSTSQDECIKFIMISNGYSMNSSSYYRTLINNFFTLEPNAWCKCDACKVRLINSWSLSDANCMYHSWCGGFSPPFASLSVWVTNDVWRLLWTQIMTDWFIDWLFTVLRPAQELFTYMETSPLPVKGCKI
jgi:hypothetical protein